MPIVQKIWPIVYFLFVYSIIVGFVSTDVSYAISFDNNDVLIRDFFLGAYDSRGLLYAQDSYQGIYQSPSIMPPGASTRTFKKIAGNKNFIKSNYFTIYYYEGCDLTKLAKHLQVNYFLHIDAYSLDGRAEDIDSIIAKLFDSIYLEVSDILDIHIYSFNGTINIFPSKDRIENMFKAYHTNLEEIPAIYLHTEKTIYLSAADVSLGVLSHEVAHAIISNYFVVAPPEKVQEVLAGYVEYAIRKATGTLSEIEP